MTRFWRRVASVLARSKSMPIKDLRAGMARVAVPDEHEHLPDEVSRPEGGPGLVAPDLHVQSPGDTVKG